MPAPRSPVKSRSTRRPTWPWRPRAAGRPRPLTQSDRAARGARRATSSPPARHRARSSSRPRRPRLRRPRRGRPWSTPAAPSRPHPAANSHRSSEAEHRKAGRCGIACAHRCFAVRGSTYLDARPALIQYREHAMPLCFIEPQDAIRVIAESVGREARRQLLGEIVRAWVDEIPEHDLDSHYAKAVADLDEHDLSMLAAWHASLEVGTPLPNKDFLVGAFK